MPQNLEVILDDSRSGLTAQLCTELSGLIKACNAQTASLSSLEETCMGNMALTELFCPMEMLARFCSAANAHAVAVAGQSLFTHAEVACVMQCLLVSAVYGESVTTIATDTTGMYPVGILRSTPRRVLFFLQCLSFVTPAYHGEDGATVRDEGPLHSLEQCIANTNRFAAARGAGTTWTFDDDKLPKSSSRNAQV